MDRRERSASQQTALLAAFQGMQSEIYTSMPALIQSFNPEKRTVTAQPVVKAQAQNPDGSFQWIALPLLVDLPVHFPEGGGVTMTFPIKSGDEALVVFANRCIDAWWQSGGIQVQADIRMHDLSDGFAFVGVSSVPRVISDISTTRAQFRSNDGEAFVEIDPESHLVRVKTSGKFEADADDDVLIKSGTRIDLQAPVIQSTAATSFGVASPIIAFLGNMSWLGVGGGAGTVTMTNMNMSISGGSMAYSNVATAYVGGTFTYNGKNLTDTHTHGGVTIGGDSTAVVN
jgi:hypothetical protein